MKNVVASVSKVEYNKLERYNKVLDYYDSLYFKQGFLTKAQQNVYALYQRKASCKSIKLWEKR